MVRRRTITSSARKVAILIATCALAAALVACGGAPSAKRAGSPGAGAATDRAAQARVNAETRIKFLAGRAARDPLDVPDLNLLAVEYMQRARETGDVSWLSRAADALERSLRIRLNDNYDGLALYASLNNTRHDFARGVELAQAALAQKPKEAYAYGALGDGYMGVGRYEDAAAAYEKMVTTERDVASFSREALLFTLTGRLDDAESMWKASLKATEGDIVPEHAAWVHAQLASFYFLKGDIERAGQEYQRSLDAFPGYVYGLGGMGRVAAARGDLRAALDYYTRAVNTVPLPEFVIALGDVYATAGDHKHAEAQYDLVGAIEQLYAANGVNLDLQIGLFNADHDRNVAATVERAKTASAAQPSVQAADMLAWVQYKAGNIDDARAAIERALRTGTLEPLVLFHAGMIYKASGDVESAMMYLRRVEKQSPEFSVLYAATAKQALAEVTAQVRR